MKSKLEIDKDGDKEWRLPNGKRHREDGPAVEYFDGNKEWWLNGKLHREDGPAVEYSNGDEEWWLNGKRHREDGPAVEFNSDHKQWWLNGIEYTEQEYKKKMRLIKLKYIL